MRTLISNITPKKGILILDLRIFILEHNFVFKKFKGFDLKYNSDFFKF